MWVSHFTCGSMKTCHTWKYEGVALHSYVTQHKNATRLASRSHLHYYWQIGSFPQHQLRWNAELCHILTWLDTHLCAGVEPNAFVSMIFANEQSPTHLSRWYLQTIFALLQKRPIITRLQISSRQIFASPILFLDDICKPYKRDYILQKRPII